jgi:hypothetical protein
MGGRSNGGPVAASERSGSRFQQEFHPPGENSVLKARNSKITTLADRQKRLDLDGKEQTIFGGDSTSVAHFSIDRPNKSNDERN